MVSLILQKKFFIVAVFTLLPPIIVFAGEWVPVDEIVSNPNIPLVDPEFDEIGVDQRNIGI